MDDLNGPGCIIHEHIQLSPCDYQSQREIAFCTDVRDGDSPEAKEAAIQNTSTSLAITE